MPRDKARELIWVQPGYGGGYNRNAVRLIPGEAQRKQRKSVVNGLIRDPDLELASGLAENTDFSRLGH